MWIERYDARDFGDVGVGGDEEGISLERGLAAMETPRAMARRSVLTSV